MASPAIAARFATARCENGSSRINFFAMGGTDKIFLNVERSPDSLRFVIVTPKRNNQLMHDMRFRPTQHGRSGMVESSLKADI